MSAKFDNFLPEMGPYLRKINMKLQAGRFTSCFFFGTVNNDPEWP